MQLQPRRRPIPREPHEPGALTEVDRCYRGAARALHVGAGRGHRDQRPGRAAGKSGGRAHPGQVVQALAGAVGARSIPRSTLGGYSTRSGRRALAEAGSSRQEADPKHADVARANLRMGLSRVAEVGCAWVARRHAAADRDRESWPARLLATFIDADKPSIPEYF